MFKKRRNTKTETLLQELRDVQDRIKNCKAEQAKSNVPIATSYRLSRDIADILTRMSEGTLDCQYLLVRNNQALDYLEELGNYLVNFVYYNRNYQECEVELTNLRNRETALKKFLGIN